MKKLAEVNAFRVAHGLTPFAALPTVMRPGKTANKNRASQNANAAARAQANRDMKALRTSKRK